MTEFEIFGTDDVLGHYTDENDVLGGRRVTDDVLGHYTDENDVLGEDEILGALRKKVIRKKSSRSGDWTEILGAMAPEPGGGPFVTIHFNDLPRLVEQKGGKIGGFAASLAPKTISAKAYGDLASKIKDGLVKEGVDADVRVVTTRPAGGPFGRDFLVGAGVGAAGVGVVFGLVKLVKHFIGRK